MLWRSPQKWWFCPHAHRRCAAHHRHAYSGGSGGLPRENVIIETIYMRFPCFSWPIVLVGKTYWGGGAEARPVDHHAGIRWRIQLRYSNRYDSQSLIWFRRVLTASYCLYRKQFLHPSIPFQISFTHAPRKRSFSHNFENIITSLRAGHLLHYIPGFI